MITKTGFPPGRPRKGELRPLTADMARAREWYAKRKLDPLFKAARAQKQAEWRAANPDRNREIAVNGRRRQKLWEEQNQIMAQYW